MFGKPRQPLRVVPDDRQEPHIVIGVVDGAVYQRLGIPLDGGQGRTQLVRNVDHEVLADAFDLLQLGMLALQLLHGVLQVFGGLIEGFDEVPELAAAGFRQAGPEVAARQLRGMGSDGEAARDDARHKARNDQRRQKRQRRAGQDLDPDRVDLAVDLRERHRDPDGAAFHRHRHVEATRPRWWHCAACSSP